MAPDSRAPASAASSTTSPREVLMRNAPGRIRARRAASIRCRVSGVDGQCRVTASLSASRSSRSSARWTSRPASAASSTGRGCWYSTRMPKPPVARRATARPMRPIPTMPSVIPVTEAPSICVGPQPCHAPARTRRSPSPMRRATARIRAIVRSAVASVSTPGVLVTTMPASRAASRSMWSTPAPKLATIPARRGVADSSSAVMRSVTVISSPSAVRRASASSAGVRARSSGLSRASTRPASRSSTGAGRRRVTTTRAVRITGARWPRPSPPWRPPGAPRPRR